MDSGKMYILAFDTTAAACSIVLAQDGKMVDQYTKTVDFGQSEILIPQIQNMLQKHNLTFDNINAVFVCVGPGSFTGVRASISAAKVFVVANPEILLSGFSAFDAYIRGLSCSDIAFCNAVIIETRRDDFYVRFYDESLRPISEPQALSREDIISFLKKQNHQVSLIGDGVERFLNEPSGLSLHSIKMLDCLPNDTILSVCGDQIALKKFNFPKPLYIRAADVTLPSK